MRSRLGLVIPPLLAFFAIASITFAARADAAGGFVTGIDEGRFVTDSTELRESLFDDTVEANAGIVRLDTIWSSVAGPARPLDPADPADPAYDFSRLDAAVVAARARGLDVIVTVYRAPTWAEGKNRPEAGVSPGTWKPKPGELAKFFEALATRYSGTFSTTAGVLPRVSRFQVWNEPNLFLFLTPQYAAKKQFSADHYRRMLNAAYKAIKSVNRANTVLTAGNAPYGEPPGGDRTRPLTFLRRLFCLRGHQALEATSCRRRANFDILAAHPINLVEGPTANAISPNDATVGDLDHIRRTLRAAERQRTLGTSGRHPLWATEFWWRSDPPDPTGVGLAKHARWYQQTLYEIWRQGASVAMILQLRDSSDPGVLATGLQFPDGSRKPAFQAFRFPFVADRKSPKRVVVWTRPPVSGPLTIERRRAGSWQPLVRAKALASKIFTGTISLGQYDRLRAVVGGEPSLAWRGK